MTLYLFRFDKYTLNLLLSEMFVLVLSFCSLFWSASIIKDLCCFKCILVINSFPPNKNWFLTSFILHLWNKRGTNTGIWLKSTLILKLLNNPLASCSLINLDFLLSQNEEFNETIVLTSFCLYKPSDSYFLYCFHTSNNKTIKA